MQKFVVFDTNVYRKIADKFIKGRSDEDVLFFSNNFFAHEKNKSLKPALHLLTAMELLSHLDNKENHHYLTCKDALIFACNHAPLNFIPPPDFYFANELFGEMPKGCESFCANVYEVLSNICNSRSVDLSLNIIEGIKTMKIELQNIKADMLKGFAGIAEGKSDTGYRWGLYPNDNRKKDALRKELNSEYYFYRSAKDYLIRIARILNIDINDLEPNESEKKILYLIERCSIPFKLTRQITLRMLDNPGIKLEKKLNVYSGASGSSSILVKVIQSGTKFVSEAT